MQMVVLLNNFQHANELLDGEKGHSAQFGTILYYTDDELLKMSEDFTADKIYGIRTFWDLQQNQEIQKDAEWQKQMLDIELKVSELEEYKSIAFFHHFILIKKQ
jgi:hypothetical protein